MTSVKFHQRIYTLKSVRESAKAYARLAAFEMKTQKPYIHVKIKSGGDVPEGLLKDEFCNYVLSCLKTGNV